MALPALVLMLAVQLPAAGAAGADGFEAYLWRSESPPTGAAAVLEAVGGTLVLRGEPLEPLLRSGLQLMLFNAPGRDELHLERERPGFRQRWQRWYDTRDDALLVREPCLTDPRTLERLERRLREALSAPGVARLAGISLGDEVGLTAHGGPEDVCLSPTCRAAWRRFLEERPDVSAEERARYADPAAASTDATRLALADGRSEALRPWLLRRHFHEAVLRSVLRRLEARARALAPGVPLGLLGVNAQSPFGTPRLERALPWLDFAEAYREVDARALLLTLREPEQRVLLTVFPRPERPDLAVWQLWEHWLRGGDGVVVWSDAELARAPGLQEAVGAALADVRAAAAAAPGFRPAPAGAAVVHDFDSLCLAWITDALLDGPTWPRRFSSHQVATGSWETTLTGWLALLADCGLQPGSVPLDDIGAATRERFGLLVLAGVGVLDEDDLIGLEAYLSAGGTLLVEGETGRLDSRGVRRSEDALERLETAAPERVLRVRGEAALYPFERAHRTARARRWREEARAWLDAAGVAPPPWRLEPSLEELPWLSARSQQPDGSLLAAVLPNWADVEGQGALPELALEVLPAEGWELQWMRPALDPADGIRRLPPGQAALFRLVPSGPR